VLVVVAVLFITAGAFALLEVLVSLVNGELDLNFGVIALLVGPGLLRLSRGWRTCALVLLWVSLIGLPIFSVLFLAHGGPLDFSLFGQKVGEVSVLHGLAFGAVLFALTQWQYRVLTRPDVRRLFEPAAPTLPG
jgi:hypothetical protein